MLSLYVVQQQVTSRDDFQAAGFPEAAEERDGAESRGWNNKASDIKGIQSTFLQAPLLQLLIGEVLEDQLASGIEGALPLKEFWALAM